MKFKIINYPELWDEIFKVRFEVFVQEQKVPIKLEKDEFDKTATHMAVIANNKIIGTLRILFVNKKAKIGRVALIKEKRGKGIGKLMIIKAIKYSKNQNINKIVLDSQTYIQEFYQDLGFIPKGEIFIDAGIPHIHMEMNI